MLGSLAMFGDPPSFVAGQTDSSPSGATQRYVGNRGKSGSARLALETTLMTVRPKGANHQ